MDGFKTCADVAKAEQEGALVVYSTDPEAPAEKELAKFRAVFPKIKPTYLRLQAGALYAKLLTERQGSSYFADIAQLSDMSFALDFQKRGGYMQYVSPELAAYKPEYRSSPEGYWTWGALVMAAIAYNPTLVTREEAPKTYQDMLDPKWADAISVKVSISGLQHVEWYVLRQLYGNDFWPQLVPLRPHAFDSYVQQFDRLVNGQDKVALTAQYSGYLSMKAKGAPVEFVISARRRGRGAAALGHREGGAASGGGAVVHGLVPRRAGTVRQCRGAVHPLAPRRCAAAARRREHQRVQGADPHRLARFRADPRAVRARVGQDHRPALTADRCASPQSSRRDRS